MVAFFLTPTIAVLGFSLVCVEMMQFRPAVYVLKPLVTLLILLLAVSATAGPTKQYKLLIIGGLALSCLGDALLMLPKKLFVQGLGAFLVAHLLYVSAFATTGGGRQASKVALVVFAAIAGVMLTVLWPTLGALRIPVALYVGVISTMAWQAWGRAAALRTPAARRAALGAAIFLVSDGTLAMNRFHAPVGSAAMATFIVMTTYLLAQWLIARSVGD
jgi:uncharacterized membrane protein YhhN